MFATKQYGDDNARLEGVILKHDTDEGYYLSVTYICENDREKYRLSIPKIKLPICVDKVSITRDYDSYFGQSYTANLGFGGLVMEPDKNGVCYTESILETKVHEMTISEIEKKLGYKIKIVNDKE